MTQGMNPTDYTSAPATSLVATRCAACGRPLLDAASVEIGMGPVCRERAGLDGEGTGADWARALPLLAGCGLAVTNDARRAANAVVHRIAADQSAPTVPVLLGALELLGFAGVAAAIRAHLEVRVPTVTVTAEGDRYAVTVADLDRETFAAVVTALRGVPGRWFDGARKVNVVPARARGALWGALVSALPPGAQITGPNGTRVVPARAAA